MKLGRNQYILYPNKLQHSLAVNSTIELGEYNISLGEETNCIVVKQNNRMLALVGYVINSNNPMTKQEEMCSLLLTELKSDNSNIGDLTRFWGGRYVLFIIDNYKLTFITDTCALKSAFYYNNVIASQARYIAYIFNVSVDPFAVNYILYAMQRDKEYSWPLDRTKYKEIKRLLPNHIYTDGIITRFYTSPIYKNLTVPERKKEATRILRNSIKAASLQRPLAITLTAGWDSRMVMAASLNEIEKYDFVTLQYINVPESHSDIQIPILLCAKHGGKHHLLKCKNFDADFITEYMEHSENGHEYWAQMAQAIRDNNYDNYFWTKGTYNEIVRNSYGILYNWQVSPNILSKLYRIPLNRFSKGTITDWLCDAKHFSNKTGYKVLDLFYWEHRLGSWLAECLNESDVTGETFTPFNTRAYFEVLRYVPSNLRTPPNYCIFMDVILNCGMEISEPINANRYNNFKVKIKCFIKNRCRFIYWLMLKMSSMKEH